MATVVDELEAFRAADKRELAKDATRRFARSGSHHFLYGLVFLTLAWTGVNTLLLLEIAGYVPSRPEAVSSMFNVGIYGFMIFTGLAVLQVFAQIAVDEWDRRGG